jgi:hypothetical protein
MGYKKRYASQAEEDKRKLQLIENRKLVGKHDGRLRINEYSDMSIQEAINVRTGLIIPE